MDVLITGHSRGLGAGLARHYLAAGDFVFGLSRSAFESSHARLTEVRCDLAEVGEIETALERLELPAAAPDLVYLNAGVLGAIDDLRDTPIADIRRVMDINVWANKCILDWLARRATPPAQIVLISSGAAVSGNRGWGAYALSKATLNMLTRLYAHELPRSHLVALAPGLVHTDMQEALQRVDTQIFPSIERLQRAMGTEAMPSPDVAAARIASTVAALRTRPSGSFVDIREL